MRYTWRFLYSVIMRASQAPSEGAGKSFSVGEKLPRVSRITTIPGVNARPPTTNPLSTSYPPRPSTQDFAHVLPSSLLLLLLTRRSRKCQQVEKRDMGMPLPGRYIPPTACSLLRHSDVITVTLLLTSDDARACNSAS